MQNLNVNGHANRTTFINSHLPVMKLLMTLFLPLALGACSIDSGVSKASSGSGGGGGSTDGGGSKPYLPTEKYSADFIVVNEGVFIRDIRICSIEPLSDCTKLPTYFDANAATADFASAKLLANGNVLATGSIIENGYFKAVALLYNSTTGTWSELERYALDPGANSDGAAIAVSPQGSVAMIVTAKDTSGNIFVVVRELLAGSTTWTTVDSFTYNVAIGSAEEAIYGSDESLFWAGKLWDPGYIGTAVIRYRSGPSGVWSTLDEYSYTGLETGYRSIEVVGDKVIGIGGVSTSPSQLLVRDCVISTGVCSNRKMTALYGKASQGSKIVSIDGDTVYLAGTNYNGPFDSMQYFLASYNYGTDALDVKHNYQIVLGNYTSFSGFGMVSDGRIWGAGLGYDNVDTRFFVLSFDSNGSYNTNYIYY
ncbi:hypothetical protein D3C87_144190 [compost metagenome]